ncbi:TetR family transcriptional regulator [Nocardia sp. NPDC051030]|uniref:TetR/AcrR family transcriptional regulator n=1 Tax=Nocardia sp. NPDC051030 TaxID=3155162 RepID=UPI003412E6E9
MTIERPYAGKLADERKQTRRAALLAAGLELLGTEGVQATSVRAVCRQSGLSSRYFYESFTDLDELLVAVFDDVMEGGFVRALEQIPNLDGDLRAIIAAVCSAFGETLQDPRAIRILLVEAWGSEALQRRRVETLHAGAAALAAVVRQDADPAPADGVVEIAAFAIMGGLLETTLAWVDGALPLPLERVFEQFIDLSVATMRQALAPAPQA